MNDNPRGEDFSRLSRSAGRLDLALDSHAASGGKVFDFRFVVFERGFGNHLHVVEARTVVHLEEAEARFRIASRANPTLDEYQLADRFGLPRDPYRHFGHGKP